MASPAATTQGQTGPDAAGVWPADGDAVDAGASASSSVTSPEMATTLNFPQWQGQLYYLTREQVPFFSSVGGMGGGRNINTKDFVFQVEDGEDSAVNNARPEGWTPADDALLFASQRKGVVEIHQHSIAVSYTRDAVTGQIGAGGDARTGALVPNDGPIVPSMASPMQKAINQKLMKIGRDLQKTLLYGQYYNPETQPPTGAPGGFGGTYDPDEVRKAQGFIDYLLQGAGTTSTTALVAGADLTAAQVAAAAALDTEDPGFAVSGDVGGAVTTWRDLLNSLLVDMFESDIDVPMATPVLWMNGQTKVDISKEYTNNFGLADRSRTVGGVNIETIITDFGVFGVGLDRYLPKNAILCADMSYINPVTLPARGKGVFFTEPLAKTGAYERIQIYGEIGFEYGPRSYHGLAVDAA